MRVTTVLLSSLVAFGLASGPAFAGPRANKAKNAEIQQPTGENMSEAQKENVVALKTTLEALKAESEITDEQKAQLQKALMNAVDGATKPSEESVSALTTSLSTAMADQSLTPKEAQQLAKDISSVLNSAGISQADAQAAAASAKTVLEASGVTKEDAQKVASALQNIATELQANNDISKEKVNEKKALRQK